MRRKSVKIASHPDFYKYMELERKKLQKMGVRKVSQRNLTKMIADNLKKKRRGLGLLKNASKKNKKKKR